LRSAGLAGLLLGMNSRLRSGAQVLPLLLIGVVPACGDSGGTPTASETQGATTQLTMATSEQTDPTGATGPGTTPTTSVTGVTEGSATAGETVGTTGGVTTGMTGTTTGAGPGTGDTSATSTTGTTMGVDPSDSTTGTTTDGETTVGPKLDMGPKVCDPDPQAATFDFIWIANSTQGTVSKINTMTGVEVGRYKTAAEAANPSRTSVNQYGDVAVSNRHPGSITRINALASKCIDANNNGMIDTSNGPNDIRAWGTDECVVWHQSFPSPDYSHGPRPTAWEGVSQDPVTCETPTPRLWGGWMDNANTAHFVRLDGDNGMLLDEVLRPGWFGSGYGPYGGAVNSEGDLYAIGLETTVVHIDSETLVVTDIPPPPGLSSYGMAVDKNGDIWVGSYGANSMFHYKVAEKQWYPLGPGGGWVLGLQSDKKGRVWGAGTGPCRLVHADVATVKYVNTAIPLPGCGEPWGTSIDNEGFVWIVDKANKAFKVNPDTYAVELVVTGLVAPYTYSDMTGQGLQLVLPQ